MKGAFIFVDAGKGHYIPAKAMYDSFLEMGEEGTINDLYKVFDSFILQKFFKYSWRYLLHHYRTEEFILKNADKNKYSYTFFEKLSNFPLPRKKFKEWYLKERPDFIVSTNFMGSAILPPLLKKLNINIPVFDYCADIFDQVRAAVSSDATLTYVSTSIGREHIIKMGKSEDKVVLSPFPLSHSVERCEKLTKKEARNKLGLDDKFTVLLNLGGEGIGDISFLYYLGEMLLDIQVVVVGGKSKTTQKRIKHFKSKYPNFPLIERGFVDNIGEYIQSCDIQMGKTGANSLMESLYLHRPFLISEVLYMGRSTPDFFKEHYAGWCENDSKKQSEIIHKVYSDEDERKRLDDALSSLDITFSAERLMEIIVEDTKSYYKNLEKK